MSLKIRSLVVLLFIALAIYSLVQNGMRNSAVGVGQAADGTPAVELLDAKESSSEGDLPSHKPVGWQSKNVPSYPSQEPAATAELNLLDLSVSSPRIIPLKASPRPTAPILTTPTPTPFRICSPLESDPLELLAKITSDPFRPHPKVHEKIHHGVDFSYFRHNDRMSILGDGVQAILPGLLSAALSNSFPYGNAVILEAPYGDLPQSLANGLGMAPEESLYVLYAHMVSPPLIQPGAWVDICQKLGEVGKSGNAGVAHLHLETRIGPAGVTFSGLSTRLTTATEEDRANYARWLHSGEFRMFDPMQLLNFKQH